jgi:ATP-dependent RNA helicase DHX29
MAKKKKPAGNPARGFTTTSVASKPKPEKSTADATAKETTPSLTKDQVTPSVSTAETVRPVEASKQEEVVQTPEELEAQLERDELQLLVEKHAPKVRRESHRNVLKFQTDRRVLRGQSHSMTVHDWLPNEILDTIIALAQAESNDSNRRQSPQPLLKILTEEDAMSKLWTLDLTLRELGFENDHIQPVLKWLCANAAAIDSSAGIWGLQEALEWLALDHCEGHSFSYEDQAPKRTAVDTPEISRPSECHPRIEMVPAQAYDLKLPTFISFAAWWSNTKLFKLTRCSDSNSRSAHSRAPESWNFIKWCT